MKTTKTLLIAAMPTLFAFAQAQEVIRETAITDSGVVTESSADLLTIAGESSPVRYTFTKTTRYTDEVGNPVRVETIKKGVPVTVHYVQDGPARLASRVIVRTAPATGTQVTATTTVKPIESVGTVTELADGSFAVRTESATVPVRYSYTKTTRWVDEAGNVVTSETVKSGTPVTVFYTRKGDQVEVAKVVVRKAPAPAPAIIEKKTTTTTTTTETK